jgi:hypothetical protein
MAVPATRRRPRWPVPAALRSLGVLLVLLGVGAMHQLTGGTHMATMTTAHAPATTAVRSATPNTGDREVVDAGMAAMPGLPAVDAQATGRSVTPHGAMPLCLAVLTGLAILALPTATSTARSTPTATPAAARHDPSPPGRGPPRGLLAQLCVLRT